MLLNQTEETKLPVNELKKYRLKKKLLKLLYEQKVLSAPELCKMVGLSKPTMKILIWDLISQGYVKAQGLGESNGGRKPSMFGLVEDALYVVACEMGRYRAKMSIFNCNHKQLTPSKFIETNIDDPELEGKLFDAANVLLSENNIPHSNVIGVGVSMPGLIDSEKGINYTVKNLDANNIRQRIRSTFNKEVFIENDARMQAYGEYMFGEAKGKDNAIVINWDWGLGLGMILNGQCYSGSTGFAGEFSHIRLFEDGELCICGKRGCLETVASATALLKMAKDGIKAGKVSQLTVKFKDSTEKLKPEHIIKVAKKGDGFAISILNNIGIAMGKGLSMIIQLLNPKVIVLSGQISKANQFVLTPIQQSLNSHCLENISENVKIVLSEHSEASGLLGITAMFYHRLFSGIFENFEFNNKQVM